MAESRCEEGSFASDLQALLESAGGADVTLVVGDSQLPAHSLLLAARSPVFAAMLRHNMEEASTRVVQITDVEEPVLRQMLSFIYTDKTPELEAVAAELLAVADKYDLPLLKKRCEEQLRGALSVENAAAAAAVAVLHGCPGLRAVAVEFIARHPEVMATGGWARLVRDRTEVAVEVCQHLAKVPPQPATHTTGPQPSGNRILTEEHKQMLSQRLLTAASEGRTREVWALLDAGAPADAADSSGTTALHKAVYSGHEDTVRCLIDAGADVNVRESEGRTPLHYAALSGGWQNSVWMLVGASACLDEQDNYGYTPLHLAAYDGYVDATKALLLAGARRDVKDSSGKTPEGAAHSGIRVLFST